MAHHEKLIRTMQQFVAEVRAQGYEIEALRAEKTAQLAAGHRAQRNAIREAINDLYAAVFEDRSMTWEQAAPAIAALREQLAACRGETQEEIRTRLRG